MEGVFEATWRPMKRFMREPSSRHDHESDVKHFRAVQECLAYVQHEYGYHTRHPECAPKPPSCHIVAPCMTRSSLYRANEKDFYTYLARLGFASRCAQVVTGEGRSVFCLSGRGSPDDSEWLPACICGRHIEEVPGCVADGGPWVPVARAEAKDWAPKPRRARLSAVLVANESDDSA